MSKDKKIVGPKNEKKEDYTLKAKPYQKNQPSSLLEMQPSENMLSSFNIGKRGLTGNAEYAFDNGAVLGVDASVPYDKSKVIDFENYDANLYGSMPLGDGEISAFIDKNKFWEAKINQKIGEDAKISAKINAENEWNANLQQKLGDNFGLNAYIQNNGGGGGLNYKKDNLSAFVNASRLDQQNKANFGVKYKF